MVPWVPSLCRRIVPSTFGTAGVSADFSMVAVVDMSRFDMIKNQLLDQ